MRIDQKTHITGFTLIELVLVTSLLTVLATTSVHSWLQWRWRVQYKQSVQAVAGAVKHAQQLAQLQHQDYWLSVEEQCIWLAPNHQGSCQLETALLQPTAIRWHPQFTQGKQLRFMAGRGLSGFGAGRIRVQHNRFAGHQADVVVSSLGRVRICENQPLLAGVPLC